MTRADGYPVKQEYAYPRERSETPIRGDGVVAVPGGGSSVRPHYELDYATIIVRPWHPYARRVRTTRVGRL